MCELPNNVIQAAEFAKHFDGFSIGSNDLTQLALGVDRDSAMVADAFNELDPDVMAFIRTAIESVHAAGRTIGICSQAPSDYPEFAEFLVRCGIDSISLSPDSLIAVTLRVHALEQELERALAEGRVERVAVSEQQLVGHLRSKDASGKTLLARAPAGEARVAFLSTDGGECVEMFVITFGVTYAADMGGVDSATRG